MTTKSDIVFALSIDDIQYQAKATLNRELTEDEVKQVKQALEYGIDEQLQIIMSDVLETI